MKFVTNFIDSLDNDVKASDKSIEEEFRAQCKNSKKDDNRFVSGIILNIKLL